MITPNFSVVIPTQNRSVLLKRAVNSVLAQTHESLELIVVDDHSTDDTAAMIAAIPDPRVRYLLNQRRRGACGARNTGIGTAQGDWIAFLDDDDIWLPDKLKHQFETLTKASASVGLICSDYAIYKGAGRRLRLKKNRPSGWVHDRILYGNSIGCFSSTCVRRDLLTKIGGLDEDLASNQDQDLWLRVASEAAFTHVPETDVIMYMEDRARISSSYQKKLDGYLRFRSKHASLIDRSLRLKHRYASAIFLYSLLLNKKPLAAKNVLWFVAGIAVDFPYCVLTYRAAFLHWYRSRSRVPPAPSSPAL